MVKISEEKLEALEKAQERWKKQCDYQNAYAKEKYDRIAVVMPKGRKEEIETHFRSKGFTKMTPYIMSLIDADMGIKNAANP